MNIRILIIAIGFISLFPSHAIAQHACITSIAGVVCPQPYGGIAVDSIGQILCGPGMCVKDGIGRVICSSTPGGSVGVDSIGMIKCVGGCIAGSARYCVSPQ